MGRKRITEQQGLDEGWYKPNKNNGLCECGCGKPAQVAKQSSRRFGHVKGKPTRYALGHPTDNLNKGNPNPPSGDKHPLWKGGTTTNRGRPLVWIPKDHKFASMRSKAGYVPEHRLVMAIHLGRPLTRYEVVHHKDCDKMNNSIENLEIVDKAAHRVIHNNRDMVARELLKKFESSNFDILYFLDTTLLRYK